MSASVIKETLNKSSAAGQRIFCPHTAVQKAGNTYSIPPLSEPCLETKSLAASSCRLNQSFLKSWAWAALTAAFGLVYEHFSHGVTSYYMLFAFLIPLSAGIARLLPIFRGRDGLFWSCGTLTLTVGSLLRGALEIYGTTSRLCGIYWILGGGFLTLAVGEGLAASLRRK